MLKLKIDIGAGLIEVEGDESFVKAVYQDYKDSLLTAAKSPRSMVRNTEVPVRHTKESDPGKKKVAKPVGRGTQTYDHELASKLDSGSIKLTDFYKERYPSSGFEQNAIFVYFLEKVLKRQNITVDDVYTCYKFMEKPNPTAMRQSLIDTSNKKQWLDTRSMENIKISSKGERLVDYDLKKVPEKAKK